jgi:hypothetical protein
MTSSEGQFVDNLSGTDSINPKRYIPFTQQRYCCVGASLQSVIERRGYKLIAQEELAAKLGLIVPEEDSYLLPHARTGQRPSAGYGTQINEPQYNPNTVFTELGYPLSFEIILPNTADGLSEMLHRVQDSDDDALLCFDYGELWDTGNQGGHVCVFASISGGAVTMIDPVANVPKFREASVGRLFKAMDVHGERNSAGIWLIKDRRGNE